MPLIAFLQTEVWLRITNSDYNDDAYSQNTGPYLQLSECALNIGNRQVREWSISVFKSWALILTDRDGRKYFNECIICCSEVSRLKVSCVITGKQRNEFISSVVGNTNAPIDPICIKYQMLWALPLHQASVFLYFLQACWPWMALYVDKVPKC